MKRKLCLLLGAAGVFWVSGKDAKASYTDSNSFTKLDTLKQARSVTVYVKDLETSKALDSVRVTIGKVSGFTKAGKVTFDNVTDAIVVLTKPGYSRVAKKLKGAIGSFSMLRTDKATDEFLIKSENAIHISGEQLVRLNGANIFDGLKTFVPVLAVRRSNVNGDNPNTLASIQLGGGTSLPFLSDFREQSVSMGLQINPSAADYRAANTRYTNTPTFFLDGVQVSQQTLQDIDVSLIEAVEVHHDALSSSIYGMRGSNGVIAVRTKRPPGNFQLSFTEQLQLATADLSSYKRLSAKEKLAIEKNSGRFDGPLESVYQNRYEKAYTDQINTNWLSIPLHNALSSKHQLSISAGNDDIVYGLNGSYNDIQGTMKGSARTILNVGGYFGARVNSFSFNNYFSYLGADATNSIFGNLSAYAKMNPYWDPLDPFTNRFQKIVEEYTDNNKTVSFKNPAYNSILSTTDDNKYTRYSNLTNLNWVIGHGFQLTGMFSIAKQSDESNYFLPPSHTVFADVAPENMYTRGMYQYTSSSFLDLQGGLRLQYQKSFGRHGFGLHLGQSLLQTSSDSRMIEVRGFAVDRLAEISFGTAYSIPKPITGKITTRYASSFASLAYDYDKRYELNASGSLDYYSNLNSGTDFYAVGAAWNVHNESFLKDVSWIDRLKIRGGIGTSANQDYLSYLSRTTYNYYTNKQYIPSNSGMGTIGIGLGTYLISRGNPNLKAPVTYKQDLGVDLDLFRNRISIYLNAFKQESKDMLFPIHAVAYTGFQDFLHYANYGALKSSGVELGIRAKVFESIPKQFKVEIMANAFHVKDEITEIGPYLNKVNTAADNNAAQQYPQLKYNVGYSPFAIWAVPSKGIDPSTGAELFLKKDGSTTTVWDAADKVYAGTATPNWVGNFGFDISYRQFSLASYFNVERGASVYNQTLADIENADVNMNLDARALSEKRWVTGMQDATYKGLYHSTTNVSTRLLVKENILQCTAISVGYLFSPKIAKQLKANQLNVRLMANNAFRTGGVDMQRGINYPFQRYYSFVLNATF